MKVILNQDVIGLGEEGDIKEVADGYARNFLLPKKLAVPNTRQNLAVLEHKRAAIEKRKEGKRLEALSLKERLEVEELKFAMPAGDNGKLFGSVNNANIAQELEKRGFTIEKKRIEIPDHAIRSVGNYKIRIKLYDKEEATMRVVVEGTAQPGAAPAAKSRQPRSRPAAHKPAEAHTEASADTPAPEPVKPEPQAPPEEG